MQDVFMTAFIDEMDKMGGLAAGLARAPGTAWSATKTVAALPGRGARYTKKKLGLGIKSIGKRAKVFGAEFKKERGVIAQEKAVKADPWGIGVPKAAPVFKPTGGAPADPSKTLGQAKKLWEAKKQQDVGKAAYATKKSMMGL